MIMPQLIINTYVSLTYKLKKKIGKVFTSKFVGTGPSSYTKRIYWAAFSQRLRNTALDCVVQLVVCCTQYVVGRWSGNGRTPLPDHRPATYWVQHIKSCTAQSKAPEDGQNCCPKHVEL